MPDPNPNTAPPQTPVILRFSGVLPNALLSVWFTEDSPNSAWSIDGRQGLEVIALDATTAPAFKWINLTKEKITVELSTVADFELVLLVNYKADADKDADQWLSATHNLTQGSLEIILPAARRSTVASSKRADLQFQLAYGNNALPA